MVRNEWAHLDEVVLGIAERMVFSAAAPIQQDPSSPWLHRAWKFLQGRCLEGRLYPASKLKAYRHELAMLEEVLRAQGARIRRPEPVIPRDAEPPGLSQLFPRDFIIGVDDIIIRGKQRDVVGAKELRGHGQIFRSLRAKGVDVLSVPTERKGLYLEGGDVLIDLPHVFVGIGKYGSSPSAPTWLQRSLGPRYKVITVPIIDPHALHLDCCLALTGPRSGIVSRGALGRLPAPLDAYDLIEVGPKVQHELGTNVLVPNPGVVIVQRRHAALRAAFKKRGFKVISLEADGLVSEGGAFRCATAPLVRGNDVI